MFSYQFPCVFIAFSIVYASFLPTSPFYFPHYIPLFSHRNVVKLISNQVIEIRVSTIGIGNNPMVGMTVSTAVSIEEAAKAGKF